MAPTRIRRAFFSFLLFFLMGCGCERVATSGEQVYFPKDSLDDFSQKWFGRELSAMREPVLTVNGKDKSYSAFRIFYTPVFAHPVALRYEKKGGQLVRRTVILSGMGGYDSAEKIIKQREVEVKQSEVDDLFAALDKSGFWHLPDKDDVEGFDGSEFVIEVVRDGQYRVFSRWTLTHQTEQRELTGLLALSRNLFRQAGLGEQIIN